jgi:hypothetical protein
MPVNYIMDVWQDNSIDNNIFLLGQRTSFKDGAKINFLTIEIFLKVTVIQSVIKEEKQCNRHGVEWI